MTRSLRLAQILLEVLEASKYVAELRENSPKVFYVISFLGTDGYTASYSDQNAKTRIFFLVSNLLFTFCYDFKSNTRYF